MPFGQTCEQDKVLGVCIFCRCEVGTFCLANQWKWQRYILILWMTNLHRTAQDTCKNDQNAWPLLNHYWYWSTKVWNSIFRRLFFNRSLEDHVLGDEHSEKRLQGAHTNTRKARVKGWLLDEHTKRFAPSDVYQALRQWKQPYFWARDIHWNGLLTTMHTGVWRMGTRVT